MAVEFKTIMSNYEVSVESENTELRGVMCSICELDSDEYDEDKVSHNIISISSIIDDVKSHNDPEILPSDVVAIKAFRELMLTPYESFGLNRLEMPIIDIFDSQDIEYGSQIFKSVFLQLKGDVAIFIIPQDIKSNTVFKWVNIYKWNSKELPAFNLDFVTKISLIKYPNHVNLLNQNVFAVNPFMSPAGSFMSGQPALPTLPTENMDITYCNTWPKVLK